MKNKIAAVLASSTLVVMINRDLEKASSGEFDLVIIGGGVTGSAIAMDAALRGLSVCIIEKNDFGCGTSAATSKLIHGGLRYLQNAELGVVRDSLKERRNLQHNAPHLVRPHSFLMTIYSDHGPGKYLMRFGFWLYEHFLGFDRNRYSDQEHYLPAAKWMDRERTISMEPKVSTENLRGGFLYYDCANLRPNRLTLEFVLTAAQAGAVCINHARAIAPLIADDHSLRGVEVRDELSGDLLSVKGRLIINAGGPWSDEVVRILGGLKKIRVKKAIGIHLMTPPIISQNRSTVAFTLKEEGHFFVIPWRGYNIIGTTDMPYDGDMDGLRLHEDLVNNFIDAINRVQPGLGLDQSKLIHAYIGARPLVYSEGGSSYRASRKHEIFDHQKLGGRANVVTVLGGKYTTARSLGETVVDSAMKKLGMKKAPSVSRRHIMASGHTAVLSDFLEKAFIRYPNVRRDVIENLVNLYGSRFHEVLAYTQDDPELLEPIGSNERGLINIKAEVHFTVKKESALTLEDVVDRRLEIGTLGDPGGEFLENVAEEMGELLDWDSSRRRDEVESLRRSYALNYLSLA